LQQILKKEKIGVIGNLPPVVFKKAEIATSGLPLSSQ